MDNIAKINSPLFMTALEVSEILGVSKPYAYRIISQLNEELSKKGYLTLRGKINRKYFYERIYGKDDVNVECEKLQGDIPEQHS